MSTNRTGNNRAYGLQNPLQSLSPQPIIAQRNPLASDKAEFGTIWINTASNAYYILTSAGTWAAQSTSSSTAASLQITGGSGTVLTVDASGDTDLGGDLAVAGATVLAGDLTVSGTLTANGPFSISDNSPVSIVSTSNTDPAITIQANGGTSETITIQSLQGTSADSVFIDSLNGGISISADGSSSNSAIDILAASGGFSIAAALNSEISVAGAGENLELNATGGSILLTSTESAVGAITLTASGANGTVDVVAEDGVNITTNDTAISLISGTGDILIGTDAAAKDIAIGNIQTATAVTITAGATDGITLDANASGNIFFNANKSATAGFTVAIDAYVAVARITGQTLAQGASQDITITNSFVTTSSAPIVTVANLNVSTNDGYLTVDGVTVAAGSFIVHVTNNGAGNLTADDTILVSFILTA